MAEDDEIYNAIIISLVIGIVIVIASLVFLRPAPEYFTELYFVDHKALPDAISPGEMNIFGVRIVNHEAGDMNYSVNVTAAYDSGNITVRTTLLDDYVFVAKGKAQDIHVSYVLPNFTKARIQTNILSQEIHFFVDNKDMVMRYPDTLARIDCVPVTDVVPAESFTIIAKGAYGPDMKVRINGTEVFFATVPDTFRNYTINSTASGILDIVYDNDHYDKEKKQDRNLFIAAMTIGNTTILPSQGVLDIGRGNLAFDCQDLRKSPVQKWNSALRFNLR